MDGTKIEVVVTEVLIRLRGRVFHKAILLTIYINRKVREQSQITGLFLRSWVVGQ